MQPQQNPKYQACKSLKELLLHNTAREKSPSVTVTSLEYVLSNCSVAPVHEALGRIPTQKENRLEHISCRVMVTLPAENIKWTQHFLTYQKSVPLSLKPTHECI